MGMTDIDDKIIKRASELGIESNDLAVKFEEEVRVQTYFKSKRVLLLLLT